MIRGLLAAAIIALTASLATAQVGTPIPSGQTVTINAHGECRQVTNPGSGTRMVFTGTAAEWTSFRNNPNGLTMSACSTGLYVNSGGGWCAVWGNSPVSPTCPGGTVTLGQSCSIIGEACPYQILPEQAPTPCDIGPFLLMARCE